MAVLITGLLLLLAMTGYSSATYCLCKDGVSDQLLQKDIDYACGNGADCSQILQTGGCYNPNTVKDHCNYAVNSFYQRKNQGPGTCDFAGTAIVSQTPPNAVAGCVYQSSPGNAGTTPTIPFIPPPGSATNPILTPPGGISPPGFIPGSSGSGINPDDTGSGSWSIHQGSTSFASLALSLMISGLVWFMD